MILFNFETKLKISRGTGLQPCFSEMSWSILVRFMKNLSVGVKESRQRGKNIVHVI